MSQSSLESLFPALTRSTRLGVNPDGTLYIPGLEPGGAYRTYSDSVESKNNERWKSLGVSQDELVRNLVNAGKAAVGINLVTGDVDTSTRDEALKDSKWYNVAHDECNQLSSRFGLPLDSVVAATASVSAQRLWTGAANANLEVVSRLASIVTNPIDIEITEEHLAMMDWRKNKATKDSGRVGMSTSGLKPGKVNSNDLDSATLAEVLYAANALRKGQTFDDWKKNGSEGTDGAYPLFNQTGTDPIKRAISVLRQEVDVRTAMDQPKFTSFYNNIRYPNVEYSSTNDTWHYRLMAMNSELTYTTYPNGPKGKPERWSGQIDELTVKERATHGKTFTPQDMFQKGPESAREGLPSGYTMFRDVTKITHDALRQLQSDPQTRSVFNGMKLHEFQALIWTRFGGAQLSNTERMRRWDDVRAQVKAIGQ